MAFSVFSVLHSEIRPDIPDAPVPTIDRALRLAARQLCIVGEVLEVKTSLVSLVSGTASYTLTVDANLEILEIVKVVDNQTEKVLAYPGDYVKGDGPTLELVKVPTETRADALRVRARVMPARTASQLDDQLINDYFDTLRLGTLAELFDMPGRDWSDKNQASYYRNLFGQQVLRARSRAQGETRYKRKTVKYGGL